MESHADVAPFGLGREMGRGFILISRSFKTILNNSDSQIFNRSINNTHAKITVKLHNLPLSRFFRVPQNIPHLQILKSVGNKSDFVILHGVNELNPPVETACERLTPCGIARSGNGKSGNGNKRESNDKQFFQTHNRFSK